MYKLFYYPRNASWAPHMVLESIGVDYDLVLVDRKKNAQKSKEYLKLNPTGTIPTLIQGEMVVFESAAICMHLCDEHPSAGLMPPAGSPLRPLCLQWLLYFNTTLQSELMLYFYPGKHTMDSTQVDSIVKAQEHRITDILVYIDQELNNKVFVLGDTLSVCDYFLFMLLHWCREFKQAPMSFTHLSRWLNAMAQRPEVMAVCKTEGTSLELYHKL